MGSYSDFLFARPSFIEGGGRLFDFAGTLDSYNDTSTGEGADRRALGADWRAVGHDIELAGRSILSEKR